MTYRPPQWQNKSPARIMVTFPGQPQSAPYSGATGGSSSLPTSQTNYVFDAVLIAHHEQELQATEHPVQTGASISDHAFIRPARIVLEIGMSDVMDAYLNPSTWTGSTSKSVSAFQTLVALRNARIPMSVTTRLFSYTNMLLRSVTADETAKTITGLRARIEFFQLFMATTLQTQNSARNQDTGTTNQGSVTPQPTTPAQQSQNGITGLTGIPVVPSTALGAGDYSSVNINNLGSLPAGK